MQSSHVDRIRLPFRPRHPFNAVIARIGFAFALLLFIAVVVFIGRDGYVDSAGGDIGVIDALYYASVTVTTTGYGDISAVTNSTRLAALVLITPARILFLILVVGTTVEVLTERSRQLLLTQRWRQRVKDHYIVCGFGSTGQSATRALVAQGIPAEEIVVVDIDDKVCDLATTLGFTVVSGDATRVAVLTQAGTELANTVVVTPNRDDTAVLVTLTARELNPNANIVAAGRAKENLHLLRQSGADEVIDSSAAVGRLLGIATQTPHTLGLIDDLLDVGTDLELADVAPVDDGAGGRTAPKGTLVVEVVRDGQRLSFDDPSVNDLRSTDRLMVVRSVRS
jgi:voltage-gated potassium channel